MNKNPKKDGDITLLNIPTGSELSEEKRRSSPPPGTSSDWEEARAYLKANLAPDAYARLELDWKKLTMEEAKKIVAQLKTDSAKTT